MLPSVARDSYILSTICIYTAVSVYGRRLVSLSIYVFIYMLIATLVLVFLMVTGSTYCHLLLLVSSTYLAGCIYSYAGKLLIPKMFQKLAHRSLCI